MRLVVTLYVYPRSFSTCLDTMLTSRQNNFGYDLSKTAEVGTLEHDWENEMEF